MSLPHRLVALLAVLTGLSLTASGCSTARASAAGGCGAGRTTPLFDPGTGTKIGFKDLNTGDYVLSSGWRLPAQALRTVKVPAANQSQETADARLSPETRDAQLRLDPILRGQAVESRANWADKNCWLMTEGGVGCFGCCGGDRCFESCWDYSSSK